MSENTRSNDQEPVRVEFEVTDNGSMIDALAQQLLFHLANTDQLTVANACGMWAAMGHAVVETMRTKAGLDEQQVLRLRELMVRAATHAVLRPCQN